eukprot:CAMPEP_0115149956 /NCGR_PEP_ID=MMETSP0227-20121206/64768_1 /TAXON_ID=89957 /ORGANISM="Polarella glacialis, Strain CCMP 1383" /LENGTH=51 /DNA_ID=CAMNT_0002560261 /DNA_START=264 /DNA_END=419 /DNA_ORIENTATION=-
MSGSSPEEPQGVDARLRPRKAVVVTAAAAVGELLDAGASTLKDGEAAVAEA